MTLLPSHLLHVPGDPGVQQELQSLPVISPGGLHRYEQVSRGEMLHRPGGSASPRGAAYRPPLPGQFLEIRGENFPARRRNRWLHRVPAARVSDCDDQHPGHEQTGDRCGGGAGSRCRAEGAHHSAGGSPHCDGVDGATASGMDRGKSGKLFCSVYNISAAQTQVKAAPSVPFSGWPPAVWLAALSHSEVINLNKWAGRRSVQPMAALSASCGRG